MSWWQLIKAEVQAIFSNPAIVLTVFGGVVFYSFLYPLPYAQQTPREQAVAVVNLDGSQMSRELERMADATPQVNIVARVSSIDTAKQLFLDGEVSGILVIPAHFYRDLLQGKSPVLSFAGDASYFLVYGTVVEGLATAGGTLAAKASVSRLVMSGQSLVLAAEQYSAVKLNLKPTFNPTSGYVNYVVPAVFVLILHQTLIMAVGLLGGTQKQEKAGYWQRVSRVRLLLVRSVVFSVIYVFLTMYYFGFSFDYYNISRLAEPLSLFTMLTPFLLSAIMIGAILGQIVPRREIVTLIVLLSSMPLVFTAGFVWPESALPELINWVAQAIPSTPAIKGFVSLNQMGADFSVVRHLWLQLWILAISYGVVALITFPKKQSFPVT